MAVTTDNVNETDGAVVMVDGIDGDKSPSWRNVTRATRKNASWIDLLFLRMNSCIMSVGWRCKTRQREYSISMSLNPRKTKTYAWLVITKTTILINPTIRIRVIPCQFPIKSLSITIKPLSITTFSPQKVLKTLELPKLPPAQPKS